jgi:hypothetical protein
MEREIIVAFQTNDKELDDLIAAEFEKEEIRHTNQFTTEAVITIIISTKESVEKVCKFFARHRDSFRTALLCTSPGIIYSLFEYSDNYLIRMTMM